MDHFFPRRLINNLWLYCQKYILGNTSLYRRGQQTRSFSVREEKAQQHYSLGAEKDKMLNEVLDKIRHSPEKGHLREGEDG